MKHKIQRLQPVFFGNRFVGTLLKTVQGFEVYSARTIKIGLFERHEAGISRLRTHFSNNDFGDSYYEAQHQDDQDEGWPGVHDFPPLAPH